MLLPLFSSSPWNRTFLSWYVLYHCHGSQPKHEDQKLMACNSPLGFYCLEKNWSFHQLFQVIKQQTVLNYLYLGNPRR